jgi:hypothetical protein
MLLDRLRTCVAAHHQELARRCAWAGCRYVGMATCILATPVPDRRPLVTGPLAGAREKRAAAARRMLAARQWPRR